jgi:hypothetical protein
VAAVIAHGVKSFTKSHKQPGGGEQPQTKLNTMKTATESTESIKELRKLIKPGTTVYTVLRHVSSSGMSRSIDLFVIKQNKPVRITWSASKGMGYQIDRNNGGIKTSGGGMDMGFNLVYNLGRTLFPKGFIPARAGQRYGRNGTPDDQRDNDGGYALNHSWL